MKPLKKRKGWILLESLLALGLMSLAAAAAFPLAGKIALGISYLTSRGQMAESAFFAGEFMTDKIRSSGKPKKDDLSHSGITYTYYEINTHGDMAPYRFFVDKDKLKIFLYNGSSQPVTGNTNDSWERIAFEPGEGAMFRVSPGGLVTISFQLTDIKRKDSYACRTAILPLADFYKLEDL